MSTPDLGTLVPDAVREDIARRGLMIYESKLKPELEPEYNNQFVVIHVDTEDYAVGRTFSQAKREIRARHPVDGRLFARKIGSEPEYGLGARILASEMMSGQSK
jgi:hypothetical protein